MTDDDVDPERFMSDILALSDYEEIVGEELDLPDEKTMAIENEIE